MLQLITGAAGGHRLLARQNKKKEEEEMTGLDVIVHIPVVASKPKFCTKRRSSLDHQGCGTTGVLL